VASRICQKKQTWGTTDPNMIAHLTLEIRIETAASLKDKRQVVRSLKDKLRASFNVAVAELDQTNLWQRATIGVVGISESRDYLQGLMDKVERAATRIANNAGGEVVDAYLEIFEGATADE
jgi:uncharacterized protein YlxP (DUF503 family)